MFLNSYSGTRVLLTGDTGFKGAWLACWLRKLGAEVQGLALPPADDSTLFVRARLGELIKHTDGDIRDSATIEKAIEAVQPQIIFHLAAQALVLESYRDPLGTMMTNVIGTAHLCDALRRYASPCAVVIVTSDKCYENHEWVYGYRENDAMGGGDPYSASKGAAELITASWRRSFFPIEKLSEHQKPIASARAGNVIGAGDWAKDRIVPDAIRALSASEPVLVRNPGAVRPWQHVLEPLSGYLWLGAKLLGANAAEFADGWNFGPLPANTRTVKELVEGLIKAWGSGSWEHAGALNPPPEAHLLRLVIDKAFAQLNWSPVWNFAETVERTAEGYRLINQHWDDADAVREVVENQIAGYEQAAQAMSLAWAGTS
jgi:CDP-glucose 4,6-dehydratase